MKRRRRGCASDFVENLAPDPEENQDHRAPALSQRTDYRWLQEYGGTTVPQARRLKELERENARLRKAVADLTLDKMILKEAAEGNF